MSPFPHPNMNQQPSTMTLQDFARLNPVIYRSSTHPLDADDWLRDITFKLESVDVAPANYVTFAAYYLKVPLLNGRTATGVPYLLEPPLLGRNSKLHSMGQCRTTLVSHDIPVEIEGLEFHVSPIVLKSSYIDLILGME